MFGITGDGGVFGQGCVRECDNRERENSGISVACLGALAIPSKESGSYTGHGHNAYQVRYTGHSTVKVIGCIWFILILQFRAVVRALFELG